MVDNLWIQSGGENGYKVLTVAENLNLAEY